MNTNIHILRQNRPVLIEDQRILLCIPESTQFPIDFVTQRIVKKLLHKKGAIKGILVEFSETQDKWTIYKAITKIEGAHFTLTFSRYQKWDRITPFVSRIDIPGKKLEVFADESGPILTVYTGDDWEQDRLAFTEACTQTAKDSRKDLSFLKYSGCFKKPCEQRSETLMLIEKKDRSSREDHPTSYNTQKVFADFIAYLETNVLQPILENPR